MSNRFLTHFLAFSSVIILVSSSSFAVSKTSRLTNFVDFYVGSSSPTGFRDGLPDVEFFDNNRNVEVESDKIYDNTFHLGLSYGQLTSKHLLWSLGLHYTDHKVADTIPLSDSIGIELLYNPTYRQLDIDFNFNLYLLDLTKSGFAPYAGLGLHGGILRINDDINQSDYSANLGMSVNFGADIKVWKSADTRTFVTLSSVNSYDFYGSSDRPKYLNIGGAIKYYFSP